MEKMVEGTRSLLKDVILSNPPWALDEDPMKQGSSPAKVCQLHSCADEAYKGGQWVTIDSSRGGRTAPREEEGQLQNQREQLQREPAQVPTCRNRAR